MIYGTVDAGPAAPKQSSGGVFSRILSEVSIKAGQDAKAATVSAIKRLAQKPTATMPDVTPMVPVSPAATVPWGRYALYGVGGLILFKVLFGGSRD